VLLGLARGAWVLRPSWVFASLEGQSWAQEPDHQVCSSTYGSVRPERKANMCQLLKDERVSIVGRTLPPRAVVQSLVEALGGSVVASDSFPTLSIVAADYTAKRQIKGGIENKEDSRIVSPSWLIEGVVTGELPLVA
jgi:hypothetical protein